MPTTIDDLSPKARYLLTTALEGHGRSKGLIIMQDAIGGVLHMVAGESQWRVFADGASEQQTAFYELLDNRLIVQFSIENVPAGYMVTPLGCEIAWAGR